MNGFVFNADRRSVMSPKDNRNRRIVKGFGIHWMRLRELIELEVARIEQEQSEPTCAQSREHSGSTSESACTGQDRMGMTAESAGAACPA